MISVALEHGPLDGAIVSASAADTDSGLPDAIRVDDMGGAYVQTGEWAEVDGVDLLPVYRWSGGDCE